jgi:hypothetical protein
MEIKFKITLIDMKENKPLTFQKHLLTDESNVTIGDVTC